ncbi:MAG: ATP-binding protein [Psychroserpens sp.]|nr:ATP-binding protein [Psychroserpens sp.]
MEENLKQLNIDCIKIVLFGPESSGKTTLCKQLAKHYDTLWVPEYAREYLQKKWDTAQKVCEPEDLLPIAIGQMELENKYAKKANKILFCDTDLLETKVYSEVYYEDFCDPLLNKYALKNQYHLYFLTYIDTPWEADDLRDKPNEREEMFRAFELALEENDRPFVLLQGNQETRLQKAVSQIDKILNTTSEFYR